MAKSITLAGIFCDERPRTLLDDPNHLFLSMSVFRKLNLPPMGA